MTPLVTIMAALAAVEQAARFGQTAEGQRMIKDLLDGGAKVEDLLARIGGFFGHLFHHDLAAATVTTTTTTIPTAAKS